MGSQEQISLKKNSIFSFDSALTIPIWFLKQWLCSSTSLGVWLSNIFTESTTWKKWLPNDLPKGRAAEHLAFLNSNCFLSSYRKKLTIFFPASHPLCLLHRLLWNYQRPHTWLSLFSQFLKPLSKGKGSRRQEFLSSITSEVEFHW